MEIIKLLPSLLSSLYLLPHNNELTVATIEGNNDIAIIAIKAKTMIMKTGESISIKVKPESPANLDTAKPIMIKIETNAIRGKTLLANSVA
jgi:hypothetical protein